MEFHRVTRDASRLVLTGQASGAQWLRACGLIAAAAGLVTLLGAFAILREVASPDTRGVIDPARYLDPGHNALGLLWLLGVLVIAALVPAYAVRVLLDPVEIVFDRDRGEMLESGKAIAPLRRFERVIVRRTIDPDRRTAHRIVIVHTDGCEYGVDQGYDEVEVWMLAYEIADFVGVPAQEA